jgi:hypothetical protein
MYSHLYPNNQQITASQILNNNNGSKQTYSKENLSLFNKILELAKDLPFWRPTPDKYIDFNIQKIVQRFDQAQSQEEVDLIIQQLKDEDREKHKQDYEEHKKLYYETLNESFEAWTKGELPSENFIRPKCCFNHFLDLPNKGITELPIFDYELYIVAIFETIKRVDILKSRGLGITELVLRYILWKICSTREWAYRMGAIITGIRLDPAVTLINRLKNFIEKTFKVFFDTKQSEFILNDVVVKAFPSRNSANTLRSYADFAFVIIDESDFFKLSDQIEIKHAAEGYFLKSQPLMVWISTPNLPGGIMENFRKQFMERPNTLSKLEPNDYQIPLTPDILDTNIAETFYDYYHIELPYHVGLGKIYDPILLAEERLKDYFGREYLLQFGLGAGDLFTETDIRKCYVHDYSPFRYYSNTYKMLTIDQGMGSSKFAFLVTEFLHLPAQNYGITDTYIKDQRFLIRVLFADEYYRPDPTQMENLTSTLIKSYNIITNNFSSGRIGIDGANIGLIKKVKEMIHEPTDYDRRLETMETHKKWSFISQMRVVPINFNPLQRQMTFTLIDYVTKGFYAIHPLQFRSLLDQMRIAKADDRGLIKERGGPTLDQLDTLRMNAYLHSINY